MFCSEAETEGVPSFFQAENSQQPVDKIGKWVSVDILGRMLFGMGSRRFRV